MPISIVCPSCRARGRAPEDLAGRQVNCPKCGSAIAVPSARAVEAASPQISPKAAKEAESPTAEPDELLVEIYEERPDDAPRHSNEQASSALASPAVAGEPTARRPSENALWYGGAAVFALLLITGLAIRSSVHEIEEARRYQSSKNQIPNPRNQIQDPRQRVPGR